MTASLYQRLSPLPENACPLCESEVVAPFVQANQRSFLRCGACGVVFQFPLRTNAEADALHNGQGTRSYFAKVEKKMRRARFEMAMIRLLLPKGGRFLDVGSNAGFMVEAARERGFEAHGIDIDQVSIDYAKKHYPKNTFHFGKIEDMRDIGQFDFIHCSEVIEHAPNAKDFVYGLARLLKPRGFLFITTPNIYHWTVRHNPASRFRSLETRNHCVFYSPSALRRSLRALGIDFRFSIPNFKPGMRMMFRKQP